MKRQYSIDSLTSQNQYFPLHFTRFFFIHLSDDTVNPNEGKQYAKRRQINLSHQLTARKQKRQSVIDNYTPSEEDILELQTDFVVDFLTNGI